MKLRMLKYPRFANLAWSVLALHVLAQNRNKKYFGTKEIKNYKILINKRK
jgi:hypothetical protein